MGMRLENKQKHSNAKGEWKQLFGDGEDVRDVNEYMIWMRETRKRRET